MIVIGGTHVYMFKKKQTTWPLFMDGVQLPQGQSHFGESVYFLPLLMSPDIFFLFFGNFYFWVLLGGGGGG